jgi:hypothetical protein
VRRAAEEWEAKMMSIALAAPRPPIDDCEFPNSVSANVTTCTRYFEIDNEWEHIEC